MEAEVATRGPGLAGSEMWKIVSHLASLLNDAQRPQEAEQVRRRAVAFYEKLAAKRGDATDWFFLAMAHWQLGDKDEARKWYDKAVEWMDKNQPKNEELLRFRAEAAELLGISEPAKSTDAAPQP